MIYVLTFIFSLIFLKLSSIFKKNKVLSVLFAIIGILIPCLLAAYRGLSIGTDVKTYVYPTFITAKRFTSFFAYCNAVYNIADILYLFVVYIATGLFSKISAVFFFLELLTILPIYIALRRKYGNTNTVIYGMALFFLLIYNQSFNMVRQSIAISFSALAFTYLEENNDKKFFIFAIIAYLFHNSSIFLIPLYFLYKILKSSKMKQKNKQLIKLLIIILIIGIIVFIPTIINLLYKYNIFTDVQINSYTVKYMRNTINFSYINTFMYLITYLFVIFNKEKLKQITNNYDYWSYIALASIFLLQLGSIITYSDRITYYMYYVLIILIVPGITIKSENNFSKKIFNSIFLLVIFILRWIYWVVIINYDATYPYIFMK